MATHLAHLTLTTGHLRRSPRSEVSDDAMRGAREMIAGATLHGWTVRMLPGMPPGSAAYDLLYDGRRVVACYLGIEAGPAAEMWGEMRRAFGHLPLPPAIQPDTPWLAVMLVPDPIVAADPVAFLDVLVEAGNLERVVAWALLETVID
mgnify:CR=1 FL=1